MVRRLVIEIHPTNPTAHPARDDHPEPHDAAELHHFAVLPKTLSHSVTTVSAMPANATRLIQAARPRIFDAPMNLMLYLSCAMSSSEARSSHFSVALSA